MLRTPVPAEGVPRILCDASGEPSPSPVAKALLILLWVVIGGYAVFAGWTLAKGYQAAARGEMPLYTDFTPTYGAALLVREIPAENLYRPRLMTQAGRRAAYSAYGAITEQQTRGVGFAPWMYPPTFILIIAPLAYLPYLLSWLAWLALTAAPYIAAVRQILPARLAWPLAFAAPPAFFNIMYGQTGFLIAGLIGMALALLERRPLLAGLLMGIATCKPHLGVLLPLALLAGGYGKAFAAASLSAISFVILSIFAYGDDPWFGFIGTSLFHLEGFDANAYDFKVMTTILSSLRLAGFTQATAWSVQLMVAALMAILVAVSWWMGRNRPETLGLRGAILCLATPLALPMTYLYDLAIIVPATAWIWADFRARGTNFVQNALLLSSLAALLATKYVAVSYGVQTGPLCVATMLGLALYRYRSALETSDPALKNAIA